MCERARVILIRRALNKQNSGDVSDLKKFEGHHARNERMFTS